jgi:nitric oxide dioxygenase
MNFRQKELIKATVPILQSAGAILTEHFYKRMLGQHPELKEVFNMGNQANGRQKEALAGAVLAYAANIDNPSVLLNVLKGIGNKHVSLSIKPEQYSIVGEHLIASIKEVLGDAANDELLEAWTIAYNQLADIMINIEKEMYLANLEKEGGWNGWRNFTIGKISEESKEIKSKIADYKAGQYVSVQVYVKEIELLQPRQYSLSTVPNSEFYRISVKKETAILNNPAGMVSNTLHGMQIGDTINLSNPAGIFSLRPAGTPIVLISGGVGVTPMLSMLETNRDTLKNKTIWVHGCRNASVHAFKEDVNLIQEEADWLDTYLFNEDVDDQSDSAIIEGRVDLNKCKEAILLEDAHYYICGPEMFIKTHYNSLINFNVSKSNIFYEEFGPGSINLN